MGHKDLYQDWKETSSGSWLPTNRPYNELISLNDAHVAPKARAGSKSRRAAFLHFFSCVKCAVTHVPSVRTHTHTHYTRFTICPVQQRVMSFHVSYFSSRLTEVEPEVVSFSLYTMDVKADFKTCFILPKCCYFWFWYSTHLPLLFNPRILSFSPLQIFPPYLYRSCFLFFSSFITPAVGFSSFFNSKSPDHWKCWMLFGCPIFSKFVVLFSPLPFYSCSIPSS